jgi:hypothetical protein
MFFKERRRDLSEKLQNLGYNKFQRNFELGIIYSPIGLAFRAPKKMGGLIDKTYQTTQDIIYQEHVNKKIDDLLNNLILGLIEYKHSRTPLENSN